MYILVGQEGCSNCLLVKKLLTSKSVEFKYEDINISEKKDIYMKMAKDQNMFQLPLIIDENNKILSMNELIQKIRQL
jgi:glutaredoxin